ncbi:MAG: OmpA family protein [Chitinophagaceae bacterium]
MRRYIGILLLTFINNNCINAQKVSTLNIYFEKNSAQLTPKAIETLQSFIDQKKSFLIDTIKIIGFADSVGTSTYNLSLSSQRATTVFEYFKSKFSNETTIMVSFVGENFVQDYHSIALNRKVEIDIAYYAENNKNSSTEIFTTLLPFEQDVDEQKFSINLNEDTVKLKGKEGTEIIIPPNSIQYKNKTLAKGSVQLILKEYYNPTDIILAGMHSMSNREMLQTAGMFNVTIVQNGDTLNEETANSIIIIMPAKQGEKALDSMNVFTLSKNEVSDEWLNSGKIFKLQKGYWDNYNYAFDRSNLANNSNWFSNLNVGTVFENDSKIERPWYSVLSKYKSNIKRHAITLRKIDYVNIIVKERNYLTHRGRLEMNASFFDKTYYLQYHPYTYKGLSNKINFINCDRFYKAKNKINYIVETPNFEGARVMLYFKDLNAFMKASVTQNGKYEFENIPANENVVIVALGKNQQNFFLGQQSAVTSTKEIGVVKLKPSAKIEFHKLFDEQ